jgi:drug/metabolite transporter (DMT)-like permease
MTTPTQARTSDILLLVALAGVWGSAFTIIKVLLDDLSPAEIAAGRLALGAIAMIALLRLSGPLRLPAASLIAPITLLSLLDTVIPYLLVGYAEGRIHSGTASVLISAMPLFTVLVAAGVLPDERLSASRIAGIAVGFGGVVLLAGSPSIGEGGRLGALAMVGAAASYGAGVVLARVLLRRIDAMALTAYKLLAGAGVAWSITAAAGDGGGFAALDARGIALLAVLGVVSTGISFAAYFRIVQRIGSVRASTVTYVIPVFGLLFGALTLGESIHATTLAGMTLIIGGVATVMYAPPFDVMVQRLRRAPRLAPSGDC